MPTALPPDTVRLSTPAGTVVHSSQSIRGRLGSTITIWSVLWALAMGLAIWVAAYSEVGKLLDEALQTSAHLINAHVRRLGPESQRDGVLDSQADPSGEHLSWQLVDAEGRVILRTADAPAQPWHSQPSPGLTRTPALRIFGLPSEQAGHILYVAQPRAERLRQRSAVALDAIAATLGVGLLAYGWLRLRVRAELRPLQDLSDRLERLDITDLRSGASMGPAERAELQAVHHAIDQLTSRLADRLAAEEAFAAHAAHALRTPLAGIDTQLAVALRTCPDDLRDRLQRVRGASVRLQTVVAALLGLFRTGARLNRTAVDLQALVSRLPTPSLRVEVAAQGQLQADEDLLAAALMNLLDNAQRYGAHHAWVSVADDNTVILRDDGPGVSETLRQTLQAALDEQSPSTAVGLGLTLADRVARSHGGRLLLPPTEKGFLVRLRLGPSGPSVSPAPLAPAA